MTSLIIFPDIMMIQIRNIAQKIINDYRQRIFNLDKQFGIKYKRINKKFIYQII